MLRDLGYDFEVRTLEVNEDHNASLNGVEIAEHLAEKKALAFEFIPINQSIEEISQLYLKDLNKT